MDEGGTSPRMLVDQRGGGMKITRVITAAIAAVIIGGTIASATPHLFAAHDKKDSVEPSASPSPGESETPEPTVSRRSAPKANPPDTSEAGGKRTAFDGDWKGQKISEEEYLKAFSAADEQYGRILTLLISAVKNAS